MFEGTSNDRIHSLSSLPDLSFVAAGGKGTADGTVGWIGRYEDSGAQVWLTWLADSYSVMDMAADSSGGHWALLDVLGDEELVHLDASGQITTRLSVSDLAQSEESWIGADRLAVVDRHVWLGGGYGEDLWVGRFDVEPQVLDTILIEDHAGFRDGIWAVAGSESEIAVAATVELSPSVDLDTFLIPDSNVLVIRFDLQGQEVGRHLLEAAEPGIATRAHSITSDGEGGWVVGGDQHPMQGPLTTPPKAWVTRIHPTEGWTWTKGGPPDGGAFVNDILVADHGLVAVGQAYGPTGARYWLAGLGLDGALHWEQNSGEPTFLAAEVTAVVLDPANRLRTTNRAWNWNGDDRTLQKSCLIAW